MISRRTLLRSGTAALLAGSVSRSIAAEPTGEPIYLGVSGPLTGPNAQYGAQWKQGFDLALDQINGTGGIKGRPLRYIFEDTQSDPKQTVAVAQKFVADKRIVAELGDFASPASMAASPWGTRRAFFGDFLSLLKGMSRTVPDSITVTSFMV